MNKSTKSLALAAAVAGLFGGTALRLDAQPAGSPSVSSSVSAFAPAGMMMQKTTLPKHSCKGKNDCKGEGGGKNAGKNSCKGQGDCATDGSKPPAKKN